MIIDVKTLRVGSLVLCRGIEHKVVAVDSENLTKNKDAAVRVVCTNDAYDNVSFGTWCSKLDNIEVSGDLLSDLGFIWVLGKFGGYYKHKDFDGFRMWYNGSDEIPKWYVGKKDYLSFGIKVIRDDVRFIHDLQNVFLGCTQFFLEKKHKL